jgi:hypothetical protein
MAKVTTAPMTDPNNVLGEMCAKQTEERAKSMNSKGFHYVALDLNVLAWIIRNRTEVFTEALAATAEFGRKDE